ncbi:MAG: formate--tetrahydrofolate ligase [Clostridiales bacterium]|nr:formate--tetrahydrofolate ligase [Clostridiales bacterium]
MKPIAEIAKMLSLTEDDIDCYGKYKAKILKAPSPRKDSKLILVTAITPTPSGEGKTTTLIGLHDTFRALGKNSLAVLREPSLGPVFGVKGGATGGGACQIQPMEDINLHFNGDFHAITSANNLISAMLDNSIFQGNELNIDPSTITFKRCLDVNDRQLRYIDSGNGGEKNGVPHKDGFDCTAASEMMAAFCMASDIFDLRDRIAHITLAYSYDGRRITVNDIGAADAVTSLLTEAIKPNLVQTTEGNPVIVHGGPFANIAHGCNSVIATRLGLTLADYVITEAGFGSDLGAEKFFDIKCRSANLSPSACVVVATIKAIKYHGGVAKEDLSKENVSALREGFKNVLRHCENMKNVFNMPTVVAVNKFTSDTDEEIDTVLELCREYSIPAALNDMWTYGSRGGIELAELVIKAADSPSTFTPAYPLDITLEEKITLLAKKVYKAKDVVFTKTALYKLHNIDTEFNGSLSMLPVCMAKTQYSFSDDPTLINAPENFTITVRDVKYSSGAGFVVVYTGSILTMPGLSKKPAALNIRLENDGTVSGIF